jgi:hypothetical protein
MSPCRSAGHVKACDVKFRWQDSLTASLAYQSLGICINHLNNPTADEVELKNRSDPLMPPTAYLSPSFCALISLKQSDCRSVPFQQC